MEQSSSSQPSSKPFQPAPVVVKYGSKKQRRKYACSVTKKARDECIAQKGMEHCYKLIEAHAQCMRDEGFTN